MESLELSNNKLTASDSGAHARTGRQWSSSSYARCRASAGTAIELAQSRGQRMRAQPLVVQTSERAAELRRRPTEELRDDMRVLLVALPGKPNGWDE